MNVMDASCLHVKSLNAGDDGWNDAVSWLSGNSIHQRIGSRTVMLIDDDSCIHACMMLDGSPVAYEVHGKSLERVDCIDGRDSVNIIIGSGDYMFRL